MSGATRPCVQYRSPKATKARGDARKLGAAIRPTLDVTLVLEIDRLMDQDLSEEERNLGLWVILKKAEAKRGQEGTQ